MPLADRVLLAEADSISTQLLSFSLQREGFEVIEARGGLDILRVARESRIDLILSEVLLPDMDGRDVCHQLRIDWNTQRIPIVLVTSLGGAEDRVQGLMAGADEYMIKPYDVRELMIRLTRLIHTYSNCLQINLLTKLPGSQLIESYFEEVYKRQRERKWALLHIDINHFQAYNRLFGFEEGNRVLGMVGDLLRKTLLHKEGQPAFVGHDGRDDFVAVVPQNDAERLCEELIERFDEEILAFYPQEHHSSTYQVLIDRLGNTQQAPGLTISVGVVTSDLCEGLCYLEIREAAADVVKRAKSEETSAIYVNRRHLVGRSLARNQC